MILDDNEAIIINEATSNADMVDTIYLIQDGEESEFTISKIWDEVVFWLEQPLPLFQFVVLPEKSIINGLSETMRL